MATRTLVWSTLSGRLVTMAEFGTERFVGEQRCYGAGQAAAVSWGHSPDVLGAALSYQGAS